LLQVVVRHSGVLEYRSVLLGSRRRRRRSNRLVVSSDELGDLLRRFQQCWREVVHFPSHCQSSLNSSLDLDHLVKFLHLAQFSLLRHLHVRVHPSLLLQLNACRHRTTSASSSFQVSVSSKLYFPRIPFCPYVLALLQHLLLPGREIDEGRSCGLRREDRTISISGGLRSDC